MKKKYLLTLLLALFSYLSAMAAVSLEEAKAKVDDYVKNTLKLDDYKLYVNTSTISKIEITFRDPISVPASSWIFFLDEQPRANWEHNASVIFVSKNSGTISRTVVYSQPKNFKAWGQPINMVKSKSLLNNSNSYDDNAGIPPHLTFDNNGLLLPNQFSKTSNRCNGYALIISGGINESSNYSRYWNDCSLYYQILIDVYGFNRNNIYVLMADGSNSGKDLYLLTKGTNMSSPLNLDGDRNTNDIDSTATVNGISWAFDQLAARMTSNDNLFIFTTDHGSRNGNLCLWNETQFSPAQMVTQLRKLKNYKTISVCMEQCYSGAFVNPLSAIDRLTICTAATANETSCGGTYGSYVNEFAYYWAMAIAQKGTADTDNDSNISMLEAFKYAQQKDDCSEHPQYWSNGCDGERLYLDGPLVDTRNLCCTLSTNALRKSSKTITSTTSITKAKVDYQSYGNIILKKGFKVSGGAKFKGKILACNSSNTNPNSLRSLDIDEDFFDSDIDSEITGIDDANSEIDGFEIFPNPTDGLLYIRANSTINKVVVSDATGKIIMDVNGDSEEIEIDLSSNAQGLYLVNVITDSESYIQKVVLK